MSRPDLDIVSVLTVVAVAIVGPEFAPYFGAYGVVVMGWFAGLLVYVWRTPAPERGSIALFSLMTLMFTIGITIGAAEWLSSRFGIVLNALLFPVAAAIPAFGGKWGDLADSGWAMFKRYILRRADQ